MLQLLWESRIQAVAVLLFAVGFTTLLLHRNLIKKVIGLNIMDTAAYLFLTSIGYIPGRLSPIVADGVTDMEAYVNPLPAGLQDIRHDILRHRFLGKRPECAPGTKHVHYIIHILPPQF